LLQFCQRRNIVEFALFGSVLRDDFRPDSDVDVLVVFSPQAQHSLQARLQVQSRSGAPVWPQSGCD
jgi:predicted nucleotidyltransferase